MEGLTGLEKRAWVSAAIGIGRAILGGAARGAASAANGAGRAAKFLNGTPKWAATRQANKLNNAGKLGEATEAAKSGIGWKGAIGWTAGPAVVEHMLSPSAVKSTASIGSAGASSAAGLGKLPSQRMPGGLSYAGL